MNIFTQKQESILSINDWKEKIFGNNQKGKHWKPGRSAHSLATHIMEENGKEFIENLCS